MFQEIYIIDDDNNLIETLKEVFKDEKDYIFKSVETEHLDIALKNIPSLIIINEDNIKKDIIDLCEQIRENTDNNITPIVVITSNKDRKHRIDILKKSIEYYIKSPIDKEYLYYTIKNIIRLMNMNRRISPLTGLPGNVQIQVEIKKRLLKKENFAILYLDLDNFKAYNDIYGFLKGDEIIKFTAKTIIKQIHDSDSKDAFIGHIGGDDFVAILYNDDYEKICKSIIEEFDKNILNFFSKEEKERGYFEVANRKGIIEEFPLTSISIAVVIVEAGKYETALEISEVGAQVKHLAKTKMGSSYAINRRK